MCWRRKGYIANSSFVCLQYVEKVRVFILEKIEYQNNTLSSHNITYSILNNILHLRQYALVDATSAII